MKRSPSGLRLTPKSDKDVERALRRLAAGVEPPRLLKKVRPARSTKYPTGTHVKAVLQGVVSTLGRVKVVSIERGDDPAFTVACVRALRKWRFEPAHREGGDPLSVWRTFAFALVVTRSRRRRPTSASS